MKRRRFIQAAGASALLSGSSVSAPAVMTGKRDLKMAMSWPSGFPGLGTSANRVAQHIEAASDHQITVKVFAAGELAGPFEVFDAVSSGAADMYHSAEYYQVNKSSAFNFFTAVPFGMTADEMAGWLIHRGGQSLWDELSAGFNIKPFMCTSTGTQMGGWFNREIRSPEDFKGLKIRMPGLGGEVLSGLGAIPVNLSGGEIFTSLQDRSVDAAEWVGPWNDLAAGLYEVAEHYYYPGFHEPGPVLALGINMDVWESFTASQQNIIKEVTMAEYTRSLSEFNIKNAEALTVLQQKHAVTPKRFSDEILAKIGKLAGEVVAGIATKDDLSARIYRSFIEARRSAIEWAGVSQEAYTTARRLDFDY